MSPSEGRRARGSSRSAAGTGWPRRWPRCAGVTDQLTAVVTVADDGGSSGRLRRELGALPPGDLRMALAALCGDDDWGQHLEPTCCSTGSRSDGDAARPRGRQPADRRRCWELLGDPVAALDWVGRLLGARGRVLPMSVVPLDIVADVVGLDRRRPGRRTARSAGRSRWRPRPGRVRQRPARCRTSPPACAEAVAAVATADWVVLGPGSWFTSVLPHLLVPDLPTRCATRRRAGWSR